MIQPYLVGDSAFVLTTYPMKCFQSKNLNAEQQTLNYGLTRTRRVVEQAFDRLKGRCRILVQNNIKDPEFAAKIATVYCALHNLTE